MSDVKWPEVGNILELTTLRDSPRVSIRHRPNLLYINPHSLALIGNPPSIWAQIDPALGRIKIGAKGDYYPSDIGRDGRRAAFPDALFMPEGTYGPVPGEEQTYQFVGKLPKGSFSRLPKKHRRRKTDGV